MSKTVDQRVVEMRFDNKHFEKNAKETLSTLDKLKMKLNLSGASKGLDNLSKSAGKVNMNPLSNALSSVSTKFSAMEVIGVTALANITNSAVNAGKRIVESLTVAPVGDGFKEYELMLNAVQTTMAGTGLTAKEVEKQLKSLDEYADKTVYSTADMLNNLPKFTNAGVELEVATKAMIGIANATAHAGGDANKASIAFYNLGQAIGTGYLTRMDYNSINNAGIATMRWKEAMVEAAIAAGTLVEVEEGLYDTGSQTLSLQQLFIDGLQDQWATADVLIKVLGDYGDETTEIGKEAFRSAQKIKTFTMMMDSLKATAGTGWKDTWQIIFGDLDEATEFWTGINDFISGIINRIADFRNKLLGGALGKTFAGLFDGIKKSAEIAKEAVQPLQDYAQLVDDIISGSWGNAPTRWEDLAAAGYDWAHAQNLVNEKLGSSVRHATNYAKAQQKVIENQEEAIKVTTDYILELLKMSNAELKALGYTDKQIAAFRELERASKKSGISLRDWIENIDEIDGRWILIHAFENAFGALGTVIKSVKDAWVETIGVIKSDHLYDFILALHKLSTYMVISDKTADKLKRTFKGVFAVLDMIFTLTKGPLMLLGRVVALFLQSIKILPRDFLGMTAVIGDYLVALRDWIDDLLDATDIFGILTPYLELAVREINKFFEAISHTEAYQKFAAGLRNTKAIVIGWMKALLEAKDIPKYIFEGLKNGLKEGIPAVIDIVMNFGKAMLYGIRKILGIHSPSTEFYEIGKNIMQGLYNGIINFIKMVYGLMMSVGNKLIEIIKGLDIGSIFTILLGSGLAFGFIKIAKVFDYLARPLKNLDDITANAAKSLKAFKGALNGFKIRMYAEAAKSFAVAIGILAASLALLTFVDTAKLWSAVGAIVVMGVLLGGLVAIVGYFSQTEGIEFGKVSLTLLALAVSLGIIAKALKTISKIDPHRCLETLLGFAAVVSGLLLVMKSIGTNGTKMARLGSTFMSIGGAFLMMALVARIIGGMDPNKLTQGLNVITIFSLIIVGLMAAMKLLTRSTNIGKIGGAIAGIAGAMLMMMIVTRIMGGMKPDQLAQGLNAITVFSLIIIGLMAATRLLTGSKNINKIGGAIFGVASAMLMMALVARIVGSMKPAQLANGIEAIAAFSVMVAGLMYATKLIAGKDLVRVGATIMAVSVAVGILGVTAALLSLINIGGLIKGIIAVGFLSFFVMGLIVACESAKQFMGTMIAITTAVGILALAVGLLSIIDPKKLIAPTLAIGIILGMFALVIAATGIAKQAIGTIVTITIIIGLLAGLMFVMSKIPMDNAIIAAKGISMMLLSMAAALAITSLVAPVASQAMTALALMLLVVGGLAVILGIMSKCDIEPSMETTKALSTLLLAMSGALVILGVVGLLGPAAFIGIGALATLIVGIGALIIGIGALMNKFPMLDKFLNEGIPIIEKIGYAIGSFFGNIVSGFAVGATSGLPQIGLALSEFITNATPFINGVKLVDKNTLTGVGILSASILALTAANLIEGCVSFLTNGKSFSRLGTELSQFIINALPFIRNVKSIDPSAMTGVKTLAEAIKILTSANLIDGIASWFTGDNALDKFGEELSGLGSDLADFASDLGTFDKKTVTTVECACKAIKALAEAASVIPNDGGFWGSLVGENSIASFGDKLPGLAKDMNEFITNLGTFDDAKVKSVDCVGKAIKALAESAKKIPNDGGLWGALVGENSLSKFGKDLPDLANNINKFVTNLGTFDDAKIKTVDCAGKAIKTLAKAAGEIENDGGLWSALVGENSLSSFGDKLPQLAKDIVSFVSNLGTFNDAQVKTIDSACKALKAIAKIGETNVKDTGKDLKSFGKNLVKFASKLKEFVIAVGDIGTKSITSAIDKTNELVDMTKNIADTDLDAIKTFGKSLKTLAKDGVNGFVKELNGTKPKEDAEKAVGELLDAVITGAKDKKTDVMKAFKTVAEAAINSLVSKKLTTSAKQAGRDFALGFASGITENKYLASGAGSDLGKAALDAAKAAIDSNSPSKEAMKVGNYFGQGLVIGIEDYASNSYDAGYNIADRAREGLSRAISKVSSLISNGIDSQPTIRPVLDLSDVESGIGNLNGMFDNNPSIGFTSNLRAISSGMNAKNQNGSNRDVVSAIDRLSRDLGNVSGTTNNYNVNGITYDDGSNMSEAVKAIVRAAIMERRT